jgi:outer membrane protein assembly factor BamA
VDAPVDPREYQQIKVNIVDVEFRGEISLSDEERSQLVTAIQRSNMTVGPNEPDTYWANGIGEIANKELHAQGHFGTRTKVTPHLVKAETTQRSYVVSCEIVTGPQYRIGVLQVVEATVFSAVELRDQIPLSQGASFDEDKILQGIKSMKLLYGSEGYIDMTGGSNALTDESKGLIDVSVQVDEGPQYRVGTVEILGVSSNAAKLLTSILESGQIFNSRAFTDFLRANRSLFPLDASDSDIAVGRNPEKGTVDIVLDFRRCSGDKVPFPPAHRPAPPADEFLFRGVSDHWFDSSD